MNNDILYLMYYFGAERRGTLISISKLRKWWKNLSETNKSFFRSRSEEEKIKEILANSAEKDWHITNEGEKHCYDKWARKSAQRSVVKLNEIFEEKIFK